MSIVISGDNQTITASDIVGSTSGLITRNTITADSSDTFDTANNIILAAYGIDNGSYTGNSISIIIFNDSNFTITLGPGTGITMKPVASDKILPQTTRNYIFSITGTSLANMFLVSSGTGANNSGITLGNAQVLIGDTDCIATGQTIQSTQMFNTVYNKIERSEQNALMVPIVFNSPYVKYPFKDHQIEHINFPKEKW
jgi:hypothetical protein